MVVWAVVSLLGLPPLDTPLPEEASRGPLTIMAVAGVGLYALASARTSGCTGGGRRSS